MISARAGRTAKRARRKSDAHISRKVSIEVPRPQTLRKRPAPGALPTPGPLRPRGRPFGDAIAADPKLVEAHNNLEYLLNNMKNFN